ncbi:MAG: hypothetical protein J6F30_16950 [Cellulosilyticum sp.]|nr:hypothetical protein [Cellulosilyticum sp.]
MGRIPSKVVITRDGIKLVGNDKEIECKLLNRCIFAIEYIGNKFLGKKRTHWLYVDFHELPQLILAHQKVKKVSENKEFIGEDIIFYKINPLSNDLRKKNIYQFICKKRNVIRCIQTDPLIEEEMIVFVYTETEHSKVNDHERGEMLLREMQRFLHTYQTRFLKGIYTKEDIDIEKLKKRINQIEKLQEVIEQLSSQNGVYHEEALWKKDIYVPMFWMN